MSCSCILIALSRRASTWIKQSITPTNTMNPVIYKSVTSVLTVLNEKEKDSKEVQELLSIFNKTKQKVDQTSGSKLHPFIVLEGLDGCGKSTTGMKLAEKLNAEMWRTPPKSIGHLRNYFDDNILRSAFYALGNYIAALEVSLILREKPVVMDRYWQSTAAYALAEEARQLSKPLPTKADSIYTWPEDLLKPDIVLFLNVSESVRTQRLSRRQTFTEQENALKASVHFRNNVVEAFKRMTEPEVVFINSDLDFGPVLEEIGQKIKPLFL